MSLGLPTQAYKLLLNIPEAKEIVKQSVINIFNDELKGLASSSILKCTSPSQLIEFSLDKFVAELTEKAPETFHLLEVLCTSERKKARRKSQRNVSMEEEQACIPVVIPTLASMIMHSRCSYLSAVAYRIGLLVKYSGAGRTVSTLDSFIYCRQGYVKKKTNTHYVARQNSENGGDPALIQDRGAVGLSRGIALVCFSCNCYVYMCRGDGMCIRNKFLPTYSK